MVFGEKCCTRTDIITDIEYGFRCQAQFLHVGGIDLHEAGIEIVAVCQEPSRPSFRFLAGGGLTGQSETAVYVDGERIESTFRANDRFDNACRGAGSALLDVLNIDWHIHGGASFPKDL